MPQQLGVIAGNGTYPIELIGNARAAGVSALHVIAFSGETDEAISEHADSVEWLRVGQLGRLIDCLRRLPVSQAIMAGQIAPGNLFSLRPDLEALLLLGGLERRNAESIFGAIADKLRQAGVELLPATTFMDDQLAARGPLAGPRPGRRELADIRFGIQLAKEISRLDIGQTVVVRSGTVLAVEGLDGTNATIRRGGGLGRGRAVVVKVSKPGQDLRFDVPVVGRQTLEVAAEARIRMLCVEAGGTLILQRDEVMRLAAKHRVGLYGAEHE